MAGLCEERMLLREQLRSTWGQPLCRESPPPGSHTDGRPTPTLRPGRNKEAAWFPAFSGCGEDGPREK